MCSAADAAAATEYLMECFLYVTPRPPAWRREKRKSVVAFVTQYAALSLRVTSFSTACCSPFRVLSPAVGTGEASTYFSMLLFVALELRDMEEKARCRLSFTARREQEAKQESAIQRHGVV